MQARANPEDTYTPLARWMIACDGGEWGGSHSAAKCMDEYAGLPRARTRVSRGIRACATSDESTGLTSAPWPGPLVKA